MFGETVTQRKQTEINVNPLKQERDWGHRKLTTGNHTSAHFSAHTLLLKKRFPPLLVNSENPSSVPADIMESNVFFKSIHPVLWLKLNHPEDKQLLAVRVHLFPFLLRCMIATTGEFVICCPWLNNKSLLCCWRWPVCLAGTFLVNRSSWVQIPAVPLEMLCKFLNVGFVF